MYIDCLANILKTCNSVFSLISFCFWHKLTYLSLSSFPFCTDVYERLAPPGHQATFLHLFATQIVSGVWHGLIPGYWMFFMTLAFLFEGSKTLYRYERNWPAWVRDSPLYTAVKIVVNNALIDYGGTAFIVLSWHESVAVWRSMYFFGHIFIFGLVVMGWVMPARRRRAEDVSRNTLQPTRALDNDLAAKNKEVKVE
jgi:small-conductance mechanosensitive channel